MKKIVYSSGIRRAVPEQPARAIAPGLNGTVWPYHADRAVHLDHEASGNLVFVQNTAAVIDAGGTVVLSPPGPDGIAVGLPSGPLYRRPRTAPAASARSLTSSRYQPAGV